MISGSRQQKTNLLSWIAYDISGTIFSLVIVTLLYAVYFKEIIAGGSDFSDLVWGVSTGVSMIVVAIASPLLGAAADLSGRRKAFLAVTGGAAALLTITLAIPGRGEILLGSILFILANIAFNLSYTFYNSLLPDVSTKENMGSVSGAGWAAGYGGALIFLLMFYPFLKGGMEENNLWNLRFVFILTGVFYLIFMVPVIFFLKLDDRKEKAGEKITGSVTSPLARVFGTIRDIKKYSNLARFLIAFFLYNDGIATVIFFSSIYASHTLGFTMKELIVFFLAIQLSAMLGAFTLGLLTDRLGAKKVIIFCVLVWCILVTCTYFVTSHQTFFAIGIMCGVVMGACQSASRTFMGLSVPPGRSAEFFGFYSLYAKFSSILGPLMFGFISSFTGDQRKAILSMLVLFVSGMAIMLTVKEPEADSVQ
ncbi:MAG: MFS transporter [Candidatus Schekmanbacteria bacterium]|nr:MFS transporter [Candidatus Schekmanbacteria bacterium]